MPTNPRSKVVKKAARAIGAKAGVASERTRPQWTFLTNHSHVLICLWRQPSARLRDVADLVGITERAVQAIVADLEAAGVLTRTREGRRNHYRVHPKVPLRHPIEANQTVGALLEMAGGANDQSTQL